MANRMFKRPMYSYEQDLVTIAFEMTVGATGAVGTVKGPVTSITRTGTGAYTVVLKDAFHKLLAVVLTNLDATASGIVGVEVPSDTADTDLRSKTLKLLTVSTGSTAADPASGSRLRFLVTARNSSVGPWD